MLLSEGRPISYRALSTSLDVHVNRAKGMLFDFHQYQNELQSDSIHATYLVSGIVAAADRISDVTDINSSSPQSENLARTVGNRKLTLVGEENLRGLPPPSFHKELILNNRTDALEMYTSVTSIHMYGLSPSTMKDFWVYEEAVNKSDVLVDNRKQVGLHDKCGTIRNPHMRLRDQKSQLGSFSSGYGHSVKQGESGQAIPGTGKGIEPQRQGKQPVTKRKEVFSTSNRSAPKTILQSFAKTSTNTSAKSMQHVEQADEHTTVLSDDGEPDDSDALPSKSGSVLHSKMRSRKDREDDLRRMMEEEDCEEEQGEPIEFTPKAEAEESLDPEASPDAEPETEMLSTEQAYKEPSETISSSGDGRRRGKRRVLKKKRILDDQGYMVTIQEQGWESFSEDEIGPPVKKSTPPAIPPSSSAKTKKTSTKGSQGSIMSFFAKK
ncbi:DNA polymerase subunit Cdc27 [Metarhizium album ARSEF 1941]|uniref:DNA polymerase delta subunit 3 n=1 Tax=Metarhizium album (strain ARSEF 1941) TaxID=1081103 RepID=A0A0B2WTB9_METAS|nr:DNA polymerase subunit Cdc27 [Metarhizium album ARSEF 1941]KHN99301.1 DNA polymerase subunit Cdc27 [Metarhizium album ARSEF 1941]